MSRLWVRVGGAVGIGGVLVVLATIPMQGSSPKTSASATVIGDFVAAHQAQYKATGLMVVLAAALASWLLATYAWLLHRERRDAPLGLIALLAGSGVVLVLACDGALEVALSFLSGQPSTVHSPVMVELYQLFNGVVMPGVAGFFVAAWLVAVAAAAFQQVVGPRWLGYLSGVLATASVAGGASGLTSIDGGTSSPVSYAPAIGFTGVVLILSVVLLRWPRLETSVVPAPPAASLAAT